MRILRKFRRMLRHSRLTQRLSVWTKDHAQRVFFYDIRICPTRDPERFLVRFDRTGMSTGNSLRVHRILRADEVHRLRLQAC